MRPDQPRPELSAIEYNRKFGRYDFHRFDHLVRHHASVGAASLGKVNVDCRFLFEKSKWGTLEGHDSAGIVYLDLAFNQPSDCRLKSATVQVTLDDEDEHLLRQYPPLTSRLPVQIDKYGPREMTGEPQYERIAIHDSFIPTFNIGNFGGVEGMGREKFKDRVRECRWKFESHLMTGSRKKGKDNRAYKVLRWQIKENELHHQSKQSNTVHTAFSFVHSGQPFFMRVEVSGRLESRASDFRHQMRDKMKRLKFPPNPQSAKCATTLINFHDRHRFTAPLDALNQRLALAMEQANMTNPVEIDGNKWSRTIQDAPIEPTPEVLAPGPDADQENMPVQIEDVTAPTNENIASLSTWLMAPPIRPLVATPEPTRDDNVPTMPSEPEPAQPQPGPQVLEEEIVVLVVNPEEDQVPNESRAQTEAEEEQAQEEQEEVEQVEQVETIVVIPRPRGLQRRISPDDRVAFSTVVLLVRIWMVQRIVTFFGYGDGSSSQSPAEDEDRGTVSNNL